MCPGEVGEAAAELPAALGDTYHLMKKRLERLLRGLELSQSRPPSGRSLIGGVDERTDRA